MLEHLNLLRGGPVEWSLYSTVAAIRNDVLAHLQLVSIEGLNIAADFEPSFLSATVTVKVLDGGGVITNNLIGKKLIIRLDGADLWQGTVKTFTKYDQQVELSLTGVCTDIDSKSDYQIYDVRAKNPQAIAIEWINGALGTMWQGDVYTDSCYRYVAQVAPPASTLDIWETEPSYDDSDLRGFQAISDGSHYQKTAVNMGQPGGSWLSVTEINPCPDAKKGSGTAVKLPLNMHQKDGYLQLRCDVGYTESPVYDTTTKPDDCLWLVGRDQYVAIGKVSYYGGGNSYENIGKDNCRLEPNGEKTVRVRTKTTKDILSNIFAALTGFVMFMKPGPVFKRVKQGTFEASKHENSAAMWSKWRAYYDPVSPPSEMADDPIADETPFDDALCGRASSKGDSQIGFACNILYKHPDSSLSSFHTNGNVTKNCVEYSFFQNIHPVTINQDPWTKDLALEAAWLGGLCPCEQPTYQDKAIDFIDLYPESGTVFDIPLNGSTCSNLEWKQNNPLPKSLACYYKTALGEDCVLKTNSFSVGDEDKELHILQGYVESDDLSTSHTVYDTYDYSYQTYERDPNNWQKGAGQLEDRFSGLYCNGNTLAARTITLTDPYEQVVDPETGEYGFPNSAFEKYGFCFLTESGTINPSFVTTTFLSVTANREIVDANHDSYSLFGSHVLNMTFRNNNGLDFFPAYQLLLASKRVYADEQRPTYTVHANWIFATAPVGSVVAMAHGSFDSGHPWLALILAKNFSTSSAGVDLTIAPMHPITADDYSAFSNLDKLDLSLPTSDILDVMPSLPMPMVNNTLPPEYAHTAILQGGESGAYWTAEEWWHQLMGSDNEPLRVPGNPLSQIKLIAKNLSTGYQSEWTVTTDNWTWNDDGQNIEPAGRIAIMSELSEAILGEGYWGKGLILYTDLWNPDKFWMVINSPDLPSDINSWQFTILYNDPAPINYMVPMIMPTEWETVEDRVETSAHTSLSDDTVEALLNMPNYCVLRFEYPEWNCKDLLLYTGQTPAGNDKQYEYQLPWDGVYTSVHFVWNADDKDGLFRFSIASDKQSGYPQSSDMANCYFTDGGALRQGATVGIYKIVRGWR